ncbi:MAG TPA: aminotransferase class V-fold PLP-dependent enzyme [Syntrophales bacterium]|nr:aminotransferase class V-fold PLP-dependent enzyme [Syntrophales bacterium]
MEILYLDNAATTWPKPPEILQAMIRYQETVGGSPGRSAHRLSIEAARIVYDTREAAADLFGIDDPFSVAFTKNATEGLNIAIQGILKPGDHCVTTGMEHNSVMRPLRAMEARGVALSVVPCKADGTLNPADVKAAIRPETRMIALIHASNITGTLMPVAEVGDIARRHGIPLLVDAAQTAGAFPIDVAAMNIDLLAFTGHKSLFGPQGTGGLYIRKDLDEKIAPLMMGGTGSRSEFEEQPDFMPDKYESGTQNAIGLAGLGAGIAFICTEGVKAIRQKELALTQAFLEEAGSLKGLRLYGPKDPEKRTAVVSFNIDGLVPSETAMRLDENYGILCRPGLHCAPLAHRTAGTFPQGTVRFSFGYYNTLDQVRRAVRAIEEISRGSH